MEKFFTEILENLEKLFNGASNFFGVLGGIIVYLLGGWDTLVTALVALMCLDYLTGILKGIYNKELSSKTGRQGIVKKFTTLVVISLAVLCEKIGLPAMREMAIMFFAVNEGISILENASQMGLPIPEQLKATLLQIRDSKEGKKT